MRRIRFATVEEAAAFVAALSRFLNSPRGSQYLARSHELEVASRVSDTDGEVTMYLSDVALDAAEAIFSPVPIAGESVGEAAPPDCLAIIDGSPPPPWGLDEAREMLNPK